MSEENAHGKRSDAESAERITSSPVISISTGRPYLCSVSANTCLQAPHGVTGEVVRQPFSIAAIATASGATPGFWACAYNNATRSAQTDCPYADTSGNTGRGRAGVSNLGRFAYSHSRLSGRLVLFRELSYAGRESSGKQCLYQLYGRCRRETFRLVPRQKNKPLLVI